MGEDLALEDFCARFKTKMLAVAGPTFDDGDSIADYADETGPTYFKNPNHRSKGPEECALTDISYWEE